MTGTVSSNHDNQSTELAMLLAAKAPGVMLKVEHSEGSIRTSTSDSVTSTDDEGNSETDILNDEFLGDRKHRKPSLKLSSLRTDIPLHPASRKSSWKVLPIPDIDRIRRTRSLSLPNQLNRLEGERSEEPPEGEEYVPAIPSRSPMGRQTVSFDQVQIRYYRQTLGDNPSVSLGPPIQLDWKFDEPESCLVDDYEMNRPSCLRRPRRELTLNHYHRVNLLQHFCGHSKEELKAAQKLVDRAKFKRAVSNFLLPVQTLEDAAESGLRKTKRLVMSPLQTKS